MAKYYKLRDLLYSSTNSTRMAQGHPNINLPGNDGASMPSQGEIVSNLNILFEKCINPIFDAFGGKENLTITSVYRSVELNKLIGGIGTSQHCFGQACDVASISGVPSSEIFNWCVDNITFDQLIWEFPERGGSRTWVHVSYVSGRNRKRTTLASKSDSLHSKYGGNRRGSYQQDINRAFEEYL